MVGSVALMPKSRLATTRVRTRATAMAVGSGQLSKAYASPRSNRQLALAIERLPELFSCAGTWAFAVRLIGRSFRLRGGACLWDMPRQEK